MGDVEELVTDLIRLRHGRGLDAARLRDRITPRLAGVFGIGPTDNDQGIRAKIRARVQTLTVKFPADQRRAVEITLGGVPGAQLALLSERIDLLAAQAHYSARTARRNVDDAFVRLAEEAIAAAKAAVDAVEDDPERGWYVERLDSLLRLDTASPEVTETRVIVAERADLSRIAIRFTVPPSGDGPTPERELGIDIAQGARIASTKRSGTSHFVVVLDLPRTLARHERHEYTVIFRLPKGQPMRPHYALIPLVRIESFHVRVRFDPADPPVSVVAFDRLPPRSIDDPDVPGTRLSLDRAYEVERSFPSLDPAFAYGISWVMSSVSDGPEG